MTRTIFRAALAACCALAPMSARAATGDLLVAPTRLILAGNSGGEVVVSNSGDSTTTYRVSLVLRRMREDGTLEAVDEANASQKDVAALDLVTYAPRRVVLAPRQSQTVRIGARVPPTVPAGEYRAHLLFRAVPDAADPAAAPTATPADGMSISLTPIYGVSIPVIVRVGDIGGGATLANAAIVRTPGESGVGVDLMRSGDRSVYGTIDVLRGDDKQPLATIKGVAAYPEVARRHIVVPIDPAKLAKAGAPIRLRFTESDPAGGGAVSEVTVATAP